MTCMFDHTEPMNLDTFDHSLDNTRPRELTPDTIAEQRDLVRGMLIHRYEKLWAYCDRNLEHGDPFDDGAPVRADPRFGELGVRVLDRISKLYRLLETEAPGGVEAPVPAEEAAYHRARIERDLLELEHRRDS